MFLSDPAYFLFLALTFLLYQMLQPGAPRRVLLLAASYFFYFQLAGFAVLIMLLVTLGAYDGARRLRAETPENRTAIFFFGVIFLLAMPLLFFKYAIPFLPPSGLLRSFALPIGISFYTFVALGYLIDVYLEVIEPERDPVRLALMLSFFSLVSAGPIERAGRFLPQLELTEIFSSERTLAALRLILIGLVLKLCFASHLQLSANPVFALPGNYPPLSKLMGVVFYAFMLYADFAGYSLIAIGSAKLFDLEVRPNIHQPFLSTSVPEFWRNWHISLSSWVRDYLFLPLRMEWRRAGQAGIAAALIFSFMILGIWHGATWGFLLFGLMHGIFVTCSTITGPWRERLRKHLRIPLPVLYPPKMLITFSLVLSALVMFRASSLHDAVLIYRGIFSLDLVRNFGQFINYSMFHRGNELDYRLGDMSASWARVGLLVAGDILVRNRLGMENMPKVFQGGLCSLGVIFVAKEWIDQNVAAPFQYYKF